MMKENIPAALKRDVYKRQLKDHTAKCMLGFIDHYQHIRNSVRLFNIHPLTQEEIEEMAVSDVYKRQVLSMAIFINNSVTI